MLVVDTVEDVARMLHLENRHAGDVDGYVRPAVEFDRYLHAVFG